jgi:beta-glucosidase-like glycosyl hydrolase
LGHAISSGKISLDTLDERARAMLKLVDRCAPSGIKERGEEIELNTPETSALLRKLASDSIVLLKNNNQLLPLSKNKPVGSFPALRHHDQRTNWNRPWSLDPTPKYRPFVGAGHLL